MLFYIEQLSFSYAESSEKQLNDISFKVEQGEFIILAGPSGSGKTTLLRHLKQEIMPKGERKGALYYKDDIIGQLDPFKSVTEIGMVYQNPEDQLVMDTVINELTFSMENIGLSSEEMKLRLAETSTYFGLEELLHRPLYTLSGGQKQLINLCSVLMLRPEVLIFDEPTVELDPIARKEFIQMVYQLNRDLNITIIMSEHLLDDVIHYANRVLFMMNGRLIYDLCANHFCERFDIEGSEMRLYLPEISLLSGALGLLGSVPLTVKGLKQLISRQSVTLANESLLKRERPVIDQPILSYKAGFYRYPNQKKYVLKDVFVHLYPKEMVGILGANGAGKSTLLKCLTGQMEGQKGKLIYNGKNANKDTFKSHIGYVNQYTKVHFSRQTVLEELEFAFIDDNQWKSELLELFELYPLLNHHPYDLSGGEQEKLAIVLALAKRPEILLLDEPTKGLDPISKSHLGKILVKLTGLGTSITLVSHDTGFVAKYTNRALLIFDGEIVYDGDSRTFLKANHYYTTMTNLVMKSLHKDCLTIEDVMYYYSR